MRTGDPLREAMPTLPDSSPSFDAVVGMDSDTIPAPPMPFDDEHVDELLELSAGDAKSKAKK